MTAPGLQEQQALTGPDAGAGPEAGAPPRRG
jgi:hypothetical protein